VLTTRHHRPGRPGRSRGLAPPLPVRSRSVCLRTSRGITACSARCWYCTQGWWCGGIRVITRLQSSKLFLVQLICGAASQFWAVMMPRHLAVRGMMRIAMLWWHRRAGLRHRRRWRHRGRRGGCHRCGSCSRASWACAVWRKPWPAGVGTRQTHRVSARRACRLRPNGSREGQRGNHRHASQEMLHVQILFVGILDHVVDSLVRSPPVDRPRLFIRFPGLGTGLTKSRVRAGS
jgi:hypothetical protein